MTDRPDSPDELEPADPPEIAEVRRLLSDARHTEPMPDDVAARMNRAIARLGDETPAAATDPRSGDVVPIAPHRRRRAAALLVAAAAVVVGGVALGPHLPHGNGGSRAGAASAGSDQSLELGNTGNGPTPHAKTSPGYQAETPRIVVRPRHFSSDALKGRSLLQRHPAASNDNAQSQAVSRPCVDLPKRVDAVAAEFRHAPAALVYRRVQNDLQVVDLYVCGTNRPIRSTTLPAP